MQRGTDMSILSSLLQQLINPDTEETVIERPCSNCPSSCAIAQAGACPECEPFKRQLIDQVYNISHLEEYYARYEVTGTAADSVSGTVICPVCGARSANHYVCEYCDSRIADAPASAGKIQVERASDIPNPIMEAQDIIFERYDTVIRKYTSSKGSRSILGDLFDALTGSDDDEDSSLGAKMSEAEIKEAAELYKMSVGDYLTGLDNGTCLTLKGKKAADHQAQFSTAASEPASFGLPGIAGIGLLSSALIHQTEIQPHYFKPSSHGQNQVFGFGQPQVFTFGKPQWGNNQSSHGQGLQLFRDGTQGAGPDRQGPPQPEKQGHPQPGKQEHPHEGRQNHADPGKQDRPGQPHDAGHSDPSRRRH